MTDHKLPSQTSFSTPINPQPEQPSPNKKWNDTEIEFNFGNPNNTALSPQNLDLKILTNQQIPAKDVVLYFHYYKRSLKNLRS